LRLLTVGALAPYGTVFAALGQQAAQTARAPEPMGVGNLIQLTLGMLAVLCLIVGIAWVLKRTGRFQMAAGRDLRVLGGLSMGTRERVVLLQVGEAQLLVGVTPTSVTPLHVLQKPLDTTPAAAPAEAGFAAQLGRFLNREQGA
jgi:flagellar protein FliO/FliZ